ncbi:MAG: hypothetical protein AB1705_02565 [Verrucomicrobiota bacterium]
MNLNIQHEETFPFEPSIATARSAADTIDRMQRLFDEFPMFEAIQAKSIAETRPVGSFERLVLNC